MESKHRLAFVPALCEIYQLEHLAPLVEEIWSNINLYSRHRGINRFQGLVLTIDELRKHPILKRFPGVLAAILPDLSPIREWLSQGGKQSNEGLEREIQRRRELMGLIGHGRQDVAELVEELERCLAWSKRSNELASKALENAEVFKGSQNFLRMLRPRGSGGYDPSCQISVLSQSPRELLLQQWRENGFSDYVDHIHGLEDGEKSAILKRYLKETSFSGTMLIIGDAPADLEAAQSVGASFFPIMPRREAESWERLAYEAWPIFSAGGYRMDYQTRLINEFYQCLNDARKKDEQLLKKVS